MTDNADGVGLLTLDPSGTPPKRRIKDCSSLNSIYSCFENDDRLASADRAALQAMLDGEPPFSEQDLQDMAQSWRCNLNWGEGAAMAEIAVSGYYDMVHSVDFLATMTIDPDYAGPEERAEWERIIAEEFNRLHLEDWPSYDFLRQMKYKGFVNFGVALAFFEDSTTWKWQVAQIGDIRLPRNATPDESTWDVVFINRTYQVHELYQAIKDPEVARKAGWKVDQVKQVLINQMGDDKIRTWEDFEVYVKNNDYAGSYGNKPTEVKAAHALSREFDCSVTHYITLQNGQNTEYLFEKPNRYKSMTEAVVLFTFGVGNGYVYGIRGLAYKIFNFIQQINQMRSQVVDSSRVGSVIMLQGQTATDSQDASLVFAGPFSILPPGLNVVPSNLPNVSQQMLPVVNDMLMTLQSNVGMYRTRSTSANGQERTKFEVQAQLSQETILSASSMNLFYTPLKKLYTIQMHRLTDTEANEADPKCGDTFLFRRRCHKRGVPLEALTKIISVEPMRSVGSGSPAARLLALDRLAQLVPFMDDAGKIAYARDVAAATVGQSQIDRYLAPINMDARPPVDAKIAELENSDLQEGKIVQVFPNELHAIHARIHSADIVQGLQLMQAGQVDPQGFLTHMQAAIPHLEMHLQYLQQAGGVWGDLVSQVSQLLQKAEAIAMNVQKQMQAQMQQQADELQQQAAIQQQQGGTVDPELQLKLQQMQLKIAAMEQKMKIDQEKHQLKVVQAQQNMGLKDAKTSQEMALSMSRSQNTGG